MRKYRGQLIHQNRDKLGVIEVVEDNLMRSLHFGTEARQSSMLLRDPTYLALSYTRGMSTALLFCHQPQRLLLLGVGGGSLAKFFLHHYPLCQIDAVEIRPAVHRVAQGFFSLPVTPRLRLFYEDANDFVRAAPPEHGEYDIILIDTFLDDGIASSISGSSFFDACNDRLAKSGVLAINLWSEDRIHATDFIDDMTSSFNREVLRLPVEGKANIIGIASRQHAIRKQLKRLDERARALEQQTGIEFPSLLKELRKANRSLF